MHVCVKGVEVRQQGCAVMQGLLFSIRWTRLGPCALDFQFFPPLYQDAVRSGLQVGN